MNFLQSCHVTFRKYLAFHFEKKREREKKMNETIISKIFVIVEGVIAFLLEGT